MSWCVCRPTPSVEVVCEILTTVPFFLSSTSQPNRNTSSLKMFCEASREIGRYLSGSCRRRSMLPGQSSGALRLLSTNRVSTSKPTLRRFRSYSLPPGLQVRADWKCCVSRSISVLHRRNRVCGTRPGPASHGPRSRRVARRAWRSGRAAPVRHSGRAGGGDRRTASRRLRPPRQSSLQPSQLLPVLAMRAPRLMSLHTRQTLNR